MLAVHRAYRLPIRNRRRERMQCTVVRTGEHHATCHRRLEAELHPVDAVHDRPPVAASNATTLSGRRHVRRRHRGLRWAELATPDLDRAMRFYSRLFDWQHEIVTDRSVTFLRAGRPGGGMRHQGEGRHAAPQWVPYFAVRSVEEARRTALQLGGR